MHQVATNAEAVLLERGSELAATKRIAHQPDSAGSVNIRALVLLAGTIHRNTFTHALRRARLDLLLTAKTTLLNHWQEQVVLTQGSAVKQPFKTCVVTDIRSPLPNSQENLLFPELEIKRDVNDYRGTGGILHDVAEEYDDNDWLLVASAAQLLIKPLPSLTGRLLMSPGDVRLLAHADGTRCGLMLVRCAALRQLKQRGYIDMKEQALPQIARTHDVRVINLTEPSSIAVTHLKDYLAALRHVHAPQLAASTMDDPLAERWQSTFSVVESDASVSSSAYLHDSVVFKGGTVKSDAMVVRSLICEGGVVESGQTIIDQVIAPASDSGATP